MLWMFPRPKDPQWQKMMQTYGKDLLKDPFFRLLDKTFLLWHIGLGAILLSAGWLCWDLRTGISLLVWGMFLRLVYVLHITWLVNSASHIWGYRNYETSDDSRNLWWVGLLAFGEGWHNNHHAFPGLRRARPPLVGGRRDLPGNPRPGKSRAGLEGNSRKAQGLRPFADRDATKPPSLPRSVKQVAWPAPQRRPAKQPH